MVDLSKGGYKPVWKNRRRVIFLALLFCAALIGYLAVEGTDTRLNETIAVGAFFLAGAVIGSYVFGAAWDDKNVMDSLKSLAGK